MGLGTAFVLGGTGFVGRAVARRLAEAGWEVTVASRGQTPVPEEVAGLRVLRLDRTNDRDLDEALGDGVDLLVDVIPYRVEDAAQLVSLRGRVGSIIAFSSGAVYADHEGRPLLVGYSTVPLPDVPLPIPESQPTLRPDDGTYAGRKVAIEQTLLEHEPAPVTIIRPPAVFGPGDTQSRELFFVKRALDGRRFVVLHDRGKNVFHVNFVENLAELVRLAAERPGTRGRRPRARGGSPRRRTRAGRSA